MKTTYRTLVRRRPQASRRLRRPLDHAQADAAVIEPLLDDPAEVGSELIALASDELGRRRKA